MYSSAMTYECYEVAVHLHVIVFTLGGVFTSMLGYGNDCMFSRVTFYYESSGDARLCWGFRKTLLDPAVQEDLRWISGPCLGQNGCQIIFEPPSTSVVSKTFDHNLGLEMASEFTTNPRMTWPNAKTRPMSSLALRIQQCGRLSGANERMNRDSTSVHRFSCSDNQTYLCPPRRPPWPALPRWPRSTLWWGPAAVWWVSQVPMSVHFENEEWSSRGPPTDPDSHHPVAAFTSTDSFLRGGGGMRLEIVVVAALGQSDWWTNNSPVRIKEGKVPRTPDPLSLNSLCCTQWLVTSWGGGNNLTQSGLSLFYATNEFQRQPSSPLSTGGTVCVFRASLETIQIALLERECVDSRKSFTHLSLGICYFGFYFSENFYMGCRGQSPGPMCLCDRILFVCLGVTSLLLCQCGEDK